MAFLETASIDQAGLSWRMRRAERFNAIGPTMAGELNAALDDLRARIAEGHGPRALVLSAETRNGIWVAGGDLKELALMPTRDEALAYAGAMQAFCLGLETLPIPVAVVLDGAAIGGGAELVLAADYVIATAEARLQFKQLHVGLPTGYGGARRLVEKVGGGRAMAWLLEGATLEAHALRELGLVQRIVDEGVDLADAARHFVAGVAPLAPAAVAAQKAMLLAARGPGRDACLAAERELFADAWFNPGHQAFLRGFTGGGTAR